MILTTRCPHCQTTFRVTDDQLKLYDGAVRCGVCQQVFNGTDHLLADPPVLTEKPAATASKPVSLAPAPTAPPPRKITPEAKPQSATPPPATPLQEESEPVTISLAEDDINASVGSGALFDALEEELSAISLELGQVTGQLFDPAPEDTSEEEYAAALPPQRAFSANEALHEAPLFPASPALKPNTRPPSSYPDPGAPAKNTVYSNAPRLDDVAEIAPSTAIEAEVLEANAPRMPPRQETPRFSSYRREPDPLMDDAFYGGAGNADDTDEEADADEPRFVRQGRAKQQSGFFTRILAGAGTLVLLGALAVQSLYMFSDRIATWWPPAESAVTRICATLSCPRRLETRIAALSIESSELQRILQSGNQYALSLLIRNSGSSWQSWPHVELTLTDMDKKPMVRRVFTPANYLPDAERIIKGIAPWSETPVKLYLDIKPESAGSRENYRVSLFYP
jgi:predicted Zn finger-like uncharacterized protein